MEMPAAAQMAAHKKMFSKKRYIAAMETAVELLLSSCALVSILTTVGVLYVLLSHAYVFFSQVSIVEFFTDTEWTPLFANKHFGVWPLISGTLLTTAIAMSVALPFGIFAALFLSEFATRTTRNILKPALEILAGIPTVVYGYFALITVTPMLQKIIPGLSGFNSLSAGIVMGIMVMPIISSLSEDALHAVPNHLKEASYGLGARKIITIFKVVLPAASSGIIASVVLAISRAIGETMIVAIAAGQHPIFTVDPRVPVETMTAYIVQVSMGDTPQGTIEYETIFAVGATLFAITFVVNLISRRFKKKFIYGH